MKIQIIGCGNMGTAILKAFLASEDASDISVLEAKKSQADYLHKNYKTQLGIDPKADLIILAIKPQELGEIDFSIFNKKAVLFSIMAGASITKLKKVSGLTSIIRAMPNLPLSVGRGVVGYITSGTIPSAILKSIVSAFSQISTLIKLKNENQIDQITALSGSGPAYFYYLTEIFAQQAKAFGFSAKDAEKIANETFIGSAKLLKHFSSSAKELKNMTTSKGGTTEAALKSFKKSGREKTIKDGIKSAHQRAKELGAK